MKEVLKNISEGLVIVVVVAILIALLNVLDKSEEKKAIARCNGKEILLQSIQVKVISIMFVKNNNSESV